MKFKFLFIKPELKFDVGLKNWNVSGLRKKSTVWQMQAQQQANVNLILADVTLIKYYPTLCSTASALLLIFNSENVCSICDLQIKVRQSILLSPLPVLLSPPDSEQICFVCENFLENHDLFVFSNLSRRASHSVFFTVFQILKSDLFKQK